MKSSSCRGLWYLFYEIFMSRDYDKNLGKIVPRRLERDVTSPTMGVEANPFVPGGLRLC